MKKTVLRTAALCLTAVMLMLTLSSCSISDLLSGDGKTPREVKVKTDLHDASFSFTYGELRQVLTPDQVAPLFELYDKIDSDTVVELSYNDIMSRFDSDDEDNHDVENIMALLSDEEKAQLTANSEQVLEYFVNSVNKAKKEKPVTEYGEWFWTDGKFKFTQDGIESDGKIKQAAKYFEHFVVEGANSKLGEGSQDNGYKITKQGDSLDDILYLYGSDVACRLTMDDVEYAISSLAYDKEPVDEEYTDENGRTKTHTVYVTTGITRVISIKLKDDEASVGKAFSFRDKKVVLDEMKKAADYFTVDDYTVSFDGCTIFVTYNAVTDNILSATYDKNMHIDTAVNGKGSLEHLGRQELSFGCTDRVEYKFGWAEEAE